MTPNVLQTPGRCAGCLLGTLDVCQLLSMSYGFLDALQGLPGERDIFAVSESVTRPTGRIPS